MLRFCHGLYHVRHLVLGCYPELANAWCHIHVDEQLSENQVNIGNINKYTLISERLEQYKFLQSKRYFNLFIIIHYFTILSGIYLNLEGYADRYIRNFYVCNFYISWILSLFWTSQIKPSYDVNARLLQDKYFFFRLKKIYNRLHCINKSVKFIPLIQCPLFLSI